MPAITALDKILGEGDAAAAAAQARDAITFAARHSPLDEDGQLVVGFLDAVAAAFTQIREDPPAAWVSGRLLSALDRLGRIPVLGDEVAAALTPAVGQRAEATRHAGHIHSWISPAIAAIKSETALQKLLLRLLAAQLPMYVQMRHGPLEYGKDIAVLIERNRRCVLRMYQLKVGDITRKNWPKTRDQLEEMFQVAMCSVQLPEQPHEMEGILLFNGHLHPHVEEVVKGWLQEQRADHHRSFTIMHLESVTRWITHSNLEKVLRESLAELGSSVRS